MTTFPFDVGTRLPEGWSESAMMWDGFPRLSIWPHFELARFTTSSPFHQLWRLRRERKQLTRAVNCVEELERSSELEWMNVANGRKCELARRTLSATWLSNNTGRIGTNYVLGQHAKNANPALKITGSMSLDPPPWCASTHCGKTWWHGGDNLRLSWGMRWRLSTQLH